MSKGLLLSWSSPSSLLLSFLSFAIVRPEKLAVLVQLVEILQADSLASRGAKPKKSRSVFFLNFALRRFKKKPRLLPVAFFSFCKPLASRSPF